MEQQKMFRPIKLIIFIISLILINMSFSRQIFSLGRRLNHNWEKTKIESDDSGFIKFIPKNKTACKVKKPGQIKIEIDHYGFIKFIPTIKN